MRMEVVLKDLMKYMEGSQETNLLRGYKFDILKALHSSSFLFLDIL
jgi:hypothetical protein